MSGATLYEIGSELKRIYAELETNGGELTPDLEVALDAAEPAFDVKVERTALMCRMFAAQRTAVDTEIKRLEALKKSAESAEKALKARILEWMTRLGKDVVRGTLITPRVQNSPAAVRHALTPTEINRLPLRFVRFIPASVELDSREVIAAYNAGEELPPGVSVERGKHVRFY
jgi:Siphovirus Gp157